MRQKIAPYVMPLVYVMTGLVLVVGVVMIAVRVLFREGAVSSMVAAGIVTEPKRGQFMQTKIQSKSPVNALKEIKSEKFDVMVTLIGFTNEIEKIVSIKAVQDGLFYDAITKIRMNIDDFSVVADEFMSKPPAIDEATIKKLADYDRLKELLR